MLVMAISMVMAIVVSFLYTTIQHSRKGQLSRSDVETYHHFIYALKSQLEDPLSCHRLLGGRQIPLNVSDEIGNISLPFSFQSVAGPFQRGSVIPNSKLVIEDIQIQRSGDVMQMRDPLINFAPFRYIDRTVSIVNGASVTPYTTVPIRILVPISGISLNLELNTAIPPKPPEAISPMKRDDLMIQILANVDASRRIYNCFGLESFAAACQTKGGAFNHLGPWDLKCQPDINCFTGNPSLVSNPAQCASQGTSPYNYKAITVGQMGTPMFVCNLCRQDLL